VSIAENLPAHLRLAGVAYVVSEFVALPRVGLSPGAEAAVKHRSHQYAHHWAIMRGLPVDTEADHESAIADAQTYRAEHPDEVEEFLAIRERSKQ
jgi:hypothetical protein